MAKNMTGSEIDNSACMANHYNSSEYEPISDLGFFDNLDNLDSLNNAFGDNSLKDRNLNSNPSEGNASHGNIFNDDAFNEMLEDELFMPIEKETPMSFSGFRPSAEPACGSQDAGLQPRWDNPPYNAGAGHQEIKELLYTMTARLERLEGAAAKDNELLRQLCFSVERSLPRLLDMSQFLRESVEGLKRYIKAFTGGIVEHMTIWNGPIEVDLEARDSA